MLAHNPIEIIALIVEKSACEEAFSMAWAKVRIPGENCCPESSKDGGQFG
jgi:hypothetical protein